MVGAPDVVKKDLQGSSVDVGLVIGQGVSAFSNSFSSITVTGLSVQIPAWRGTCPPPHRGGWGVVGSWYK